jgi:hypothetical protein
VLVWADAVCIDQANVCERNVQVANMIYIYSRAASVVVWTGEDDERGSGGKCLAWLESIARRPNFGLQCEIRAAEMGLLENFFAREWFRRRWVVQEAAVAPHAWVMCGAKRIAWYDFVEGVGLLRVREDKAASAEYQAALKKVCTIEGLNKRYRTMAGESTAHTIAGPDLLQMMVHFEASLCSDARDRVFSLVRLARFEDEDMEELSSGMDYSLPVERVYTTFARVLLRASDQYALLHYAGAFRSDNNTTSSLPSWAPDWRVRPRFRPLLHPDFHCGLGTTGSVQFSVDGSIIMQGCIVDRVASDEGFKVGGQKRRSDFGMALAAIQYQDAIEKVGNLRGNIHPEASQNEIVTDVLIQHRSLRDAKLMIDEAAEGFKGSSDEHALQAQASWTRRRHVVSSTASTAREAMRGRRLFKTERGKKGIGPKDAEQGDIVAIICGTRTPFIIRESAEGTGWSVIGDAWISGSTAEAIQLKASMIQDLRIV